VINGDWPVEVEKIVLTLYAYMDIVLGLLYLARILIGLGEGVCGKAALAKHDSWRKSARQRV
jgi:uncharacterized membrane protein YadS